MATSSLSPGPTPPLGETDSDTNMEITNGGAHREGKRASNPLKSGVRRLAARGSHSVPSPRVQTGRWSPRVGER